MIVPRTIADVLKDHVTLEVESIDRLYLNVYVPRLQRELGVVSFFRFHRGHTFASSSLMEPITTAFVAAIDRFTKEHQIPVITFQKGQRKDDVAAAQRATFTAEEGIVFVGKAQEKTSVFRTEKRRHPQTGKSYAWIVRSTAMVNHYYFYGQDRDFGPFFLKFCSYFPYNAKLYLNGHEYAKQQLSKAGVTYVTLDNGFQSCADPARLQTIADELSPTLIDSLLRKWLSYLPNPFTAADREAGYSYDISILQVEFALTQVLDRPLTGRIFFEEVIRENLDLGRPDHVQLIFNRRVTKRTPGRFRTRVITDGVIPSLHVDYKKTRVKQYHKEGRALRTETTINDTRDFAIGKRLHNLPALRVVGFQANRSLLATQRISHDCAIGEDAFRAVTRPIQVDGQRASALPFGDPRVQSLFSALALFCLLPQGFSNRELRESVAPLLGLDPSQMTQGRMTYDLRRLRLHGLVRRIPKTHRYQLTDEGLRITLFFNRVYLRILRPGLATILPEQPSGDITLRQPFDRLATAIDRWVQKANLVA
ncbi:MAG: hypothetical protein EPO21_18630 [Chloroflexota bacterium]|nr:MAG: hypothetical protein EPO21_18630 [Chloroflexota bacterium]